MFLARPDSRQLAHTKPSLEAEIRMHLLLRLMRAVRRNGVPTMGAAPPRIRMGLHLVQMAMFMWLEKPEAQITSRHRVHFKHPKEGDTMPHFRSGQTPEALFGAPIM